MTPLELDADGDWYLSSDELQRAVGGGRTADLSAYRRAIASATDQIDEWTGRRFLPDPAASPRTFRAISPYRVCVGDFADPALVTVATDDRGDGTWSTWDASEWAPGAEDEGLGRGAPRAGHPWRWIVAAGARRLPTSRFFDRIKVTAVWGWSEPPQAIVQACLHLARWNYEATDRLEQVMDSNPLEKAKTICRDYAVDGGGLYCQPLVG